MKAYNWAAMLDGLSKGLFALGKEHLEGEREVEKTAHEDKRDAANRAFQENLERFRAGADIKRDAARAAADEASRAADRASHEKLTQAEIASREKSDLARIAEERNYHSASLGMEGKRIDLERTRTEAADRKADAAEKRADATEKARNATTALTSVNAEMRVQQDRVADLQKELGDIAKTSVMPPNVLAAKQEELAQQKKSLDGLQNDARSLRKAAGFQSSLDTSGADHLAPDRQQLYDDLLRKNPKLDPAEAMKRVKSVPQETLDAAISTRPTASAESTPDAFMPAPPGAPQAGGTPDDVLNAATPPPNPQARAQATAQNAGQPAGVPAVPGAPQAPGADNAAMPQGDQVADTYMGNPPAVAEPPDSDVEQPTDDQAQGEQDPDAQFADVTQQLQQTPEGQGIHTTLDRLAQLGEGPAADKLRRSAQIQLQQQFPDMDPDAYIDQYLQQQQQSEQPAYA